MREGWRETTLGEVVSVINVRAGVNAHRILSVTEKRGIVPQEEVFARRIATEDTSKYKVLAPLDIAYNPYLLWAGAVGQWRGNTIGVTSPVYECFRVLPSHDPRFVGLILESGHLGSYFKSTAIGSIPRRRRTPVTVFLEAPILLPPLDEQRRIVDLVAAVDEAIEAAEAMKGAADQARHGLLGELLSEERAEHEGWRNTTLGEVASWYSGGTPRAGDDRFYGGSIPWAVIGDLQDSQLAATANTITEDGLAQIGGRLAPPGSVLVSMYGTIGRSAIARNPLATNQAIAWGEVLPDCVTPEYLLRWLYHQRPQLDGQARGATQRNINRRIIREFSILLPPLDEQRRIVDIISAIDDQASTADSLTIALRTLRSALLSDLLSGDHEIPASYDALLSA